MDSRQQPAVVEMSEAEWTAEVFRILQETGYLDFSGQAVKVTQGVTTTPAPAPEVKR